MGCMGVMGIGVSPATHELGWRLSSLQKRQPTRGRPHKADRIMLGAQADSLVDELVVVVGDPQLVQTLLRVSHVAIGNILLRQGWDQEGSVDVQFAVGRFLQQRDQGPGGLSQCAMGFWPHTPAAAGEGAEKGRRGAT